MSTKTVARNTNHTLQNFQGANMIDCSTQIKFIDLAGNAYKHFKGVLASPMDLRKFMPTVFDCASAGYSCSCTFFFCLMIKVGLADSDLQGRGVSWTPSF